MLFVPKLNKHGTQKVYNLIVQEAELPLSKVPSNLLHSPYIFILGFNGFADRPRKTGLKH